MQANALGVTHVVSLRKKFGYTFFGIIDLGLG